MNTLVIGGSGFLGSHIADELTSCGHNVTIFDVEPSLWVNKNQKFVEGDILDLIALEKEISKTDVVYHMAAISDINEAELDPLKTISHNIIGSTNIISLCSKHSVRLMYGSTVYVYSKHGSFYRASKQSVETLIEVFHEKQGLHYTIIRYGSLYGPRSQPWNGLKRIVNEMVTKKKIVFGGTGKEKREYIHVIDASKMSIELLDESYLEKAVTLTGIQVLSQSELLEMVAEIMNTDVLIDYDIESRSHSHYKLTPYQYVPKSSIKLISKEYIDIGQGILELISEITRKTKA